MNRGTFQGRLREGTHRHRRGLLFLTSFSLFLLTLAILSGFELAGGTPVVARAPQVVDINTPDFGMPAGLLGGDDILPTTPQPLALVHGAGLSPAGRQARLRQAATPTGQAGGPTLEVTPEVGAPGTQLTLTGRGWAPDEAIILRLQDAGPSQAMLAEYSLAITDSGGNFRANYTIPTDPPWGQLPALLLWAASTKTGVQTRSPRPFVITNAAAQTPAGVRALQVTETPTMTPSPTAEATTGVTATLEATSTPVPTSNSPVNELQSGGGQNFVVATPMPTSTPAGAFESPVPTPETTRQASPRFIQPTSPVAPGPVPTAQAQPGVLPSSGAPLLATTLVTAGPVALHSQPGQGRLTLLTVSQGAALGVLGQNTTGDWLLVTTTQGVQGWLPRAATDFAGNALP